MYNTYVNQQVHTYIVMPRNGPKLLTPSSGGPMALPHPTVGLWDLQLQKRDPWHPLVQQGAHGTPTRAGRPMAPPGTHGTSKSMAPPSPAGRPMAPPSPAGRPMAPPSPAGRPIAPPSPARRPIAPQVQLGDPWHLQVQQGDP